jgi:hypothetical protein
VTYMTKFQDNRMVRARSISRKVKEIILNKQFWECCTNFREVAVSVMWALWDFDGKGPCMEKILFIFYNLKKHVLSLRGESFGLDRNLADAMEDAFHS